MEGRLPTDSFGPRRELDVVGAAGRTALCGCRGESCKPGARGRGGMETGQERVRPAAAASRLRFRAAPAAERLFGARCRPIVGETPGWSRRARTERRRSPGGALALLGTNGWEKQGSTGRIRSPTRRGNRFGTDFAALHPNVALALNQRTSKQEFETTTSRHRTFFSNVHVAERRCSRPCRLSSDALCPLHSPRVFRCAEPTT